MFRILRPVLLAILAVSFHGFVLVEAQSAGTDLSRSIAIEIKQLLAEPWAYVQLLDSYFTSFRSDVDDAFRSGHRTDGVALNGSRVNVQSLSALTWFAMKNAPTTIDALYVGWSVGGGVGGCGGQGA